MTRAILVTGGAGYVGSHTVATLLDKQADQDFEIVVIDNLTNAYRTPGEKKPESLRIIEELTDKTIHFYEADIRDVNKLSHIFETVSKYIKPVHKNKKPHHVAKNPWN
jgi:UDP-glucose 4-epimerase